MPIYEYACARCRKIYSFLSKRIQPERQPACPKCGNPKLERQMSGFAMLRGVPEPSAAGAGGPEGGAEPEGLEGIDDARVERVMGELERDMEHLDESNPRHVAHMMRKMKEILPEGAAPKELEVAIRRLEQGEDPEKVEEDMGDVLGELMGGAEDADADGPGGRGAGGGYSRDGGLYDY